MARNKAAIVQYAHIDGIGWRRGPVVIAKNGKVKPGFMVYNQVEYPAPDARFQIRTYSSGTAKYTTVPGNTYEAAVEMMKKYHFSRQMEEAEEGLGIRKAEEASKDAPKTLQELVTEYIAQKKSPSLDLSATAIRHYEDALLGFPKSSMRQFVTEVTEDDIIQWMDTLSKKYSKKTCHDRYVNLRGFLRNSGINVEKLISTSVHKRYAAKPEGDTTPYTQEQLDRLFAVCDLYHRNVFTFLLATGMRYREAAFLTWADIDMNRWVITLPRERKTNRKYRGRDGKMVSTAVVFETKSRRKREVPVFASLRPMLLEWRSKNPTKVFVFGSKRSDMPNNHWLLYLKRAWRKAGLNCNVCDGCSRKVASRKVAECGEAFLHRFRHSFAHRCLDNGIGIHKVSAWLGHHSIEVSQIYLRGASVEADRDPFAPVKVNVVSISSAA